jgi:putative transposase
MARLPLYFIPDVPLHIILRGNNRTAVFLHSDDYPKFKETLVAAAVCHGLAIHAYVFMTNHVHLLASPSSSQSAPRTMQSVGRRYVQYFNLRYKRTGTLWEGRYRATVVDTERYLFQCMRYIELNPVRAGMVTHPEDFAWSSYRANAEGQADQLITPHALYERLSNNLHQRIVAYRSLFGTPLKQTSVDEIRHCTNRGWALGTDQFKAAVETISARRPDPLPQGRWNKAR